MRGRLGRIAIGVLSVGVVMVLAASLTVSAGPGVLSWVNDRVDRAAEPTGAKQTPPETAEKAEKAKEAPEDKKAEKEEDKARKKLDDKEQKKVAKAESVPKEPEEKLVAPADTTMSLDVPAIGLNDVMVYEGTGESSLYYGTGHLSGTGYPWVKESNTYIAGHRVGYPGTGSDYVFWDLPALGVGDEVYLTDANGQTYTYKVSEILEVPITDLSVTAPVAGRDVLSLQTCIENYGDYWTEGPNWLVRYVVRADKVKA